jgi:hypothetical protein
MQKSFNEYSLLEHIMDKGHGLATRMYYILHHYVAGNVTSASF